MRTAAAGLLAVLCLACTPGAPESPRRDVEEPLWLRSTAEPYPFTTPVPPLEETAIDGTYARTVPRRVAGGSVACRRCAPYRLEVGRTTLELREGRYQVSHQAPGKPDSSQFRAKGHFRLTGDRIVLFNDANCSRMRGTYRWSVEGPRLRLEVIDDPCPFSELRSRFLTATPWVVQG